MTKATEEEQFEQIKPLAEAMFGISIELVTRNGNFLPHGGALSMTHSVSYIAGMPDNEITNSTEVLPLVHEALRQETAKFTIRAVAVSENVFIGKNRTPAIKVLIEHRDGLTIAMYQPFRKRFLRSPVFDDVQVISTEAEIGGWS